MAGPQRHTYLSSGLSHYICHLHEPGRQYFTSRTHPIVMQLSDVSSLRNVATIIYIFLSQIALALSLPVDQPHNLRGNEARAPRPIQPPAKRDISSSTVGAIGGGAFALVLLALVIGLGSASIAILGSLEWGEFRDKKKPEQAEADAEKQRGADEQDKETAVSVQQTRSSTAASTAQQAVTGEKAGGQPPRGSRLTLKGLLPRMEFSTAWLNHSNKA